MGYRMCLLIYPGGYAHGKGKGTHLSLFLYVMKGVHDNNLTWPLQGKCKVKLLNQISNNEHLPVTINFNNSSRIHGLRVTTIGNRAMTGWGERYELFSNEDIRKGITSCQFLKDDCICFEVKFFK